MLEGMIKRVAAFAIFTLCAAAAQKDNAEGQVYRIGDGVSAPVVIFKFEPQYTPEARDAKLQGTVLMAVEIDEAGIVRYIKVLRPLELGLTEKAMEAVGQWKFRPGTKEGKPVRVLANVEMHFRLI